MRHAGPYFSSQGLNPCFCIGRWVLTGPPGKSHYNISFKFFSNPTVIFGSRALWIKERIYFLPCTQLVKNLLQCRRPWFDCWVGKIRWRRGRLLTPVFLDFPDGSDSTESACNAGDLSSIPGLISWRRNGNPLQYSVLENPWTI